MEKAQGIGPMSETTLMSNERVQSAKAEGSEGDPALAGEPQQTPAKEAAAPVIPAERRTW